MSMSHSGESRRRGMDALRRRRPQGLLGLRRVHDPRPPRRVVVPVGGRATARSTEMARAVGGDRRRGQGSVASLAPRRRMSRLLSACRDTPRSPAAAPWLPATAVRPGPGRRRSTLYPFAALELSPVDWQQHYGPIWPALARAKRRYDPDGVLASGPDVFRMPGTRKS